MTKNPPQARQISGYETSRSRPHHPTPTHAVMQLLSSSTPHPILFNGRIYGSKVFECLIRIWRSHRSFSPNCIIIHGPAGSGKSIIAAQLAHRILSSGEEAAAVTAHNDHNDTATSERNDNSSAITSLSHPDLMFCHAYYETNSLKEKEMAKITMAEVEQLTKFAALSPLAGMHKVAIIDHAEYLNASSSTALLKLIEEANSNTTVIITTDSLSGIAPSLLSRGSVWYNPPLGQPDFDAAIQQHFSHTEIPHSERLHDLTDGNLSIAVAMVESGLWGMVHQEDDLNQAMIRIARASLDMVFFEPGSRICNRMLSILMRLWHKSVVSSFSLDDAESGNRLNNYMRWRDTANSAVRNMLDYISVITGVANAILLEKQGIGALEQQSLA